jgi:hypothetical protein
MNRTTRRFLHASLVCASVAAFVGAASPRIAAWSDTSNANLIATTRAASCLATKYPIVPNSIAIDDYGQPLPAGRYLCYWDGATAQTGKGGVIGYIRAGQPEKIAEILATRGFQPPPRSNIHGIQNKRP